MLSHEVEEKLAELLVNRIEETNALILNKIGNSVKMFANISVSEAYQLANILKYGGSYSEIAKYLSKMSGQNVKDIYKIFENVAKQNKEFAKNFYKYRGIDFIPYSKDIALQNQVNSISKLTSGTFLNLTNTTTLGYIFEDLNGNKVFKNIQRSYEEIIDRSVISIIQGKSTFYQEMRNTLKQLGKSGLVQYESGVVRRLDSAVRMNILSGIRQVNMETSRRFGKEYGADGVEITVHSNPAPDHADIQGRQFADSEYELLQSGLKAKDVKGTIYDGADKRPIGELNCYHSVLNIIIGISKPQYTDEQLKKIKEENEKGFDFKGKHYTKYEGTQLQRKYETAIRKQKDIHILATSSGDKELAIQCQMKIKALNNIYTELCDVSGLIPKKERMTVSGYRRK